MMNACRISWELSDSIEKERKQLQLILEESHFDFQDEQVQEASRRMDRMILFHYKGRFREDF